MEEYPEDEEEMSDRSPFSRPDGVHGGVDPEFWPEISNDVEVPVAGDPSFQPRPGEAGLQEPPEVYDWSTDSAAAYDPWDDPNSSMTTGEPAVQPDVPVEAPVVPVPRVDVREAVFGRVIPWRHVALVSAVVLALGGIGGYVGGRLGGWDRSEGQRVELVQEEGRPAETLIGDIADTVQPAVASIRVGDPRNPEAGGMGSGFVIDDQGHILTNNHVISMAANDPAIEVQVQLQSADGSRLLPAHIVGRDTMMDLAVLKVDDVAGLSIAALGNSDEVRVGDTVVALGSPLGLNRTVTAGIVSATQRPVRLAGEGTDTDGAADAIQTDASINPGNSGGPLVDARGAVIGINTSIYTTSGGSQGIGFAVPINTAAGIAEQIIAGEEPVHPTIGVTSTTVENGILAGAQLATVVPGSPADRGGLREGDVVTGIGGREVGGSDELRVAIWSAGANNEVPFQIIRDGEPMELLITPSID